MPDLKIAIVHAQGRLEPNRNRERFVLELTSYLRNAGHKVDVFLGTKAESQFHITPAGRNFRFRIPRFQAMEALGVTQEETFGIRALVPMLVHRYDVVHAFTATGALAALATGHRTVFTLSGCPMSNRLPRQRLRHKIIGRAIGWATETATLGRTVADSVEAIYKRCPVTLPPGLETGRRRTNPQPRSGPPSIFYSDDAGRSSALSVLLPAFGRVLGQHPAARLTLAGGRSARAQRAMGAEPDVVRKSIDVLAPAPVEEIQRRLRSSHVNVLPSMNEGGGVGALESLACGTPVVGWVPGPDEDIVDSAEVGRLVPLDDVDALAGALVHGIELAQDPATPGRCRAHAEQWDWALSGLSYEALYSSVAGRHSGARRERSP